MGLMLMSDEERLRKAVLEMVKQKKLTLVQAAIQCGLSYRQILRIYERYKAVGDAGLTHNARGRRSNRKNPHHEAIIMRYQERYKGFGPTLAAEYLEEDGYIIDHETLRRLLLAKGLWERQRKRSPYRCYRECRDQFGELIQIDGSSHDWLGEGCLTCLLNMVDDATGKTLAILGKGETTRIIFLTLWKWIELYGIPLAIYVDLKNAYVSPKITGFSHVEVACAKLGILIIKAYSPQAKGRVERKHAVYQDRFVKELYLKQVKTIEEANVILEDGFIDKLNHKFEKIARNPQSAHRPLNGIDLNQIFCWEYERRVSNDWTFSFLGKTFQIEKVYGSCVKPKSKIVIRKHLDDMLSVWYKKEKLIFKVIPKRLKEIKKIHNIKFKTLKPSPKPNHSPWHQSNSFVFKEETPSISKVALRKRHS